MYLETHTGLNKFSHENGFFSNRVFQRKCDCGSHISSDGNCQKCKNDINSNTSIKANVSLGSNAVNDDSNFLSAKIRQPDFFDSENTSSSSLPRSSMQLPYREATELAECISIMGEDNAAHCRSIVLGEDSELPVNTSINVNTPAAVTPTACNPIEKTRAQYLAEPGTSTSDFGLTALHGMGTVPRVQTNRTRRGFVVLPTQAVIPRITSVFTGAGQFTEGEIIFTGDDRGCRQGRYPIRWNITRGGAQKIKDGEKEHCDDFHYAFNTSLARYATAVNTVAQSNRLFASQRSAERHLERTVGVAPNNWNNVFRCLARKTLLRDGQRGARGSHTPRPSTRPPMLRDNCQFARVYLTARSLPHVGQRSSSQLITGC